MPFMRRRHPTVVLAVVLAALPTAKGATPSIARIWDERALAAIRVDTPHPPAQARNLFSLSVAMYDAWAAYDPTAVGYVYQGKHTSTDVAAARREAISYAAYRTLMERHVYSRTASETLAADTAQLTALGYSPANVTRDTANPAGVGNAVYDAVWLWFSNDGSRQTNGLPYTMANPPVAYPDYPANQGGYTFINPPLATAFPGITDGGGRTVVDVNRWQRLMVVNAVDQSGFPQGPIQDYLGAQWLGVRPFALSRENPARPWIDPGPPPFFGAASHAAFISNIVEVIRCGSELTPDDGAVIDTSPGAVGNNSLGANDGTGHPLNPATGVPYAPNRMKRGDFARVLAEFWADGPHSETPPGHWNSIANDVGDFPGFLKRIGGTGPVVDDLEWDVKLYLALNAALHDAACTAWSIKRVYDGWRPITAIRYVAGLGQASDPRLPSYHPFGLPLVTNLIELATPASISSRRHAGIPVGKIALRGWPGQPSNPSLTYQGVRWMVGENWTPYQRANFVSPAFPGYVSGHSTFSRAGAEVLTAFTGSPFFPGGLGTYTVQANTGLIHEKGPSQTVQLQWGTYFDAADQAGLSRIWGGIHPPADDFAGRIAGSAAGKQAWALVQKYWDGSITVPEAGIRRLTERDYEFQFITRRGFHFQVQSTTELGAPFVNEGEPIRVPFDSLPIRRTNRVTEPQRFHRVISVPAD